MNGKGYIMLKQRSWAKRNGLELLPGAVGRDDIEKNYLSDVALNLFEPLSEGNLASVEKGDGNEMKDGEKRLAKMKAIHSSAEGAAAAPGVPFLTATDKVMRFLVFIDSDVFAPETGSLNIRTW